MQPSDHPLPLNVSTTGPREPLGLDARIELSEPLRVLVVDDRELVAHGLRTVLHAVVGTDRLDLQVTGSGADRSDVAQAALRHRPHVVVLDGAQRELLTGLREHDPSLRLVALAADDDGQDALDPLLTGADAVVSLTAPPTSIALAVLAAATGSAVLPTKAVTALTDRVRPAAPADLADEHLDVWRLVAEGATDRRIASVLHVSERTAKRRVAAVLRKLAVSSRVEAAFLAGWYAVVDGDRPPGPDSAVDR